MIKIGLGETIITLPAPRLVYLAISLASLATLIQLEGFPSPKMLNVLCFCGSKRKVGSFKPQSLHKQFEYIPQAEWARHPPSQR